jgi:hypothetical protein
MFLPILYRLGFGSGSSSFEYPDPYKSRPDQQNWAFSISASTYKKLRIHEITEKLKEKYYRYKRNLRRRVETFSVFKHEIESIIIKYLNDLL